MPRYTLLILAALAGTAVMTAFDGDKAAFESRTVATQQARVGDAVDPATVEFVDRPGLYGVSDPAAGTRYAIVGSSLVRLDTASHIIRSIIRPVPRQAAD